MMPENFNGEGQHDMGKQVQIQMSEQGHRALKYRSAQCGVSMGQFTEQMLQSLKMRALRLHRKIGNGTYLDDAILIRAILEADAHGWTEADALNLASADLTEAEADGVEATFEANVDG